MVARNAVRAVSLGAEAFTNARPNSTNVFPISVNTCRLPPHRPAFILEKMRSTHGSLSILRVGNGEGEEGGGRRSVRV